MKLLAAKPLLCVVAELVFADVSILSEPAAIDAVAEPNNTVALIMSEESPGFTEQDAR